MPNLTTVLQQEIRRLAKSEAKELTSQMKRASVQYRRDIAELKRQIAALQKQVASLEKQERKRVAQSAKQPDATGTKQLRYSPAWLRKHRAKLEMSAANYAKLIGCSALSIYNWEQEKSQPRQAQIAALAAIRSLGMREAWQRLEIIENE